MGKRSSIAPFLTGAVAGAAVTWGVIAHDWKEPPPPPLAYNEDMGPEQWLLPPGSTMENVFMDGALLVLEDPDQVTLHELSNEPPGEAPDAIVHDGHAFHATGKDARLELLLHTVRSISAYRGLSMCEFKPAVLLRFTQDDRHLDLLFCFGCRDMLAFLDGRPCGGAGMSDDGYESFLYYFRKVLPENELLKTARGLP
jgi:hypothetical protein